MNKKTVEFIFPRQHLQDRRNVFEGSRTVAVLETVQHSEKAHATWVPCTKDQESSAAKHVHAPRVLIQNGTGRKTILPGSADKPQSARCCRDRYLCRKSLPFSVTATSKYRVLIDRIKEKI